MGQIETFEGNKMNEEDFKKMIENIPKMTTEDLMKEYFKLRDETDWTSLGDFGSKKTLLNEMADEMRRRHYGKDRQT